jgi:transposase
MDSHASSTSWVALNRADFLGGKKFPASPEMMVNYFKKQYPQSRIAFAYEVGPTGFELYDALTRAEYVCLVVAASTVPQERGKRVKNDRIDAGALAEALRAGTLRGIRVPWGCYRHLRHLTQLRDTLVQQVRSTKCRIKALLLQEGLRFPEASSPWSKAVVESLKKGQAYEKVRFKLDSLLASLDFSSAESRRVTMEVVRYCRSEPELSESLEYLRSIPGIGSVVAAEVLARVGDWRWLESVDELGSFFGLTPWEHSTGEDVNRGNITRMGHSRARSLLVEASWIAIRKDPELRNFYRKICRRHPRRIASKVAIVAVARKLTRRIYAVLTERRCYVIREVEREKV